MVSRFQPRWGVARASRSADLHCPKRAHYANNLHVDSDGDGVPDDKDQCPNTPAGDIVDAHGCTIYHLVPISPPDFPYKVTVETKCTESIAGVCLRRDIVRVCVGGNCFDVPTRITGPLCLRCLLGASVAIGAALGVVGAILWLRRRRP
jgi:hypothetical protein